jgi:hypothetical protein
MELSINIDEYDLVDGLVFDCCEISIENT